MSQSAKTFRLAELVATLSLGTDLGLGQPMEHVIRQTLIALRMSERLGFDESERAVVYYSGLLAWVGCHTDAYEQAKWFGDDIALKADGIPRHRPRAAVLAEPPRRGEAAARARAPRRGVRRGCAARRPRRSAEPLAGRRRAGGAPGPGRRRAPEPQGELRALGRQGPRSGRRARRSG